MSFEAEQYVVVRNAEEQYSIWPADRPVPQGWQDMEVRGSREECLTHIENVWTDMRPASLRAA
ncbi:MbtH family protein [Plantactinospora sp. GCM10030261]|uniref:MbtH family protein n=1 Tax=Plantactinospora sp. GCM10030261 TaxID=3273420 RepID=UPI003614D473